MQEHDNNALVQISDGLARAVEIGGRSTLTVKARRRLPATGVAWTESTVVTASHVVEREEDIKIVLTDGREATAKLAGRDPGTDLALLRVDGAGLSPATRAEGAAAPGALSLALGRAMGLAASFGVVSAVGGPWRTFSGSQVEGYIRADVTLYPGFSGGPLIDVNGAVLGINSSRLGRGGGITLPVSTVARVAEALQSGGRIKRGYLGIGNQPVKLPAGLAQVLGGQESGLLIVSVEPGTAADKAELLVGDILVGLGATPVRDTEDLQGLLGPETVGKETRLTILRGGEKREVTAVVGERGQG